MSFKERSHHFPEVLFDMLQVLAISMAPLIKFYGSSQRTVSELEFLEVPHFPKDLLENKHIETPYPRNLHFKNLTLKHHPIFLFPDENHLVRSLLIK